ncbi:hypothetical protein [Actinopolymorpha pittospori]
MRPSPALRRRVPVVTAVLLVLLAALFPHGSALSHPSPPGSSDPDRSAVASAHVDADDTSTVPRARPAAPSAPSGDAPAVVPGSPVGTTPLGLAATPPEPAPLVQANPPTPPEPSFSAGIHATTSGTCASRAPPSPSRA